MTKVISVINWKGGVGKTTLTHHIGVQVQNAANDKDKYPETKGFPRTLLLDLDPQCSLSIAALGESQFEAKVYGKKPIKTVKDLFELYLDNKIDDINIDDFTLKEKVRADEEGKTSRIYKYVDLLPSHPDLIYTDMEIATFSKRDFRKSLIGAETYKFRIVETFIEKLKDKYDFIIIDCPPNLNYITQNALYSSEHYLIPTILDKLSSYGILSIKNKVDDLNELFSRAMGEDYKKTELIGIVANNVREYEGQPKKSQMNVLKNLKKLFINKVFKSYLTNGDGIPKAMELGYPVFAIEDKHANAKKQSRMIRRITKEFLERIKSI